MIDLLTSPEGVNPVVISAVFAASPERLFDAWTRAEDLRKWFGNDPSDLTTIHLDLSVGGLWRFEMKAKNNKAEYLEGQYINIDRPRFLCFSWVHVVVTHEDHQRQTPPSQVSVHFEALGAATRITLEHKEIASPSGRIGVRTGWKASFQKLAKSLALEGERHIN
ncbi:SRPBCC family protein [Roseobacter sp. EG26]|uniref:SRPBCC family protein n=1 Tax=Roseobacter sp. EG26 TaxID=3412477 RepID=UPI003CE5A7D3